MGDRINVDKLMKVLSEILSEKYDCKITMKAVPKDSEEGRELMRKRAEQEAIRKAEGAKAG